MEKDFYLLTLDFNNYLNKTIITKDEINNLIIMLLDLYSLALKLPEVNSDNNIDFYLKVEPEKIKLGEVITNRYWLLFDPYKKEELVTNTIIDDLEDISKDLKFGAIEYEKGNINNALFLWKYSHKTHWGEHIANLLKVLNTINYLSERDDKDE